MGSWGHTCTVPEMNIDVNRSTPGGASARRREVRFKAGRQLAAVLSQSTRAAVALLPIRGVPPDACLA